MNVRTVPVYYLEQNKAHVKDLQKVKGIIVSSQQSSYDCWCVREIVKAVMLDFV